LNEKVELPKDSSASKKAIDDKWINVDNQIKRENLVARLNNYILKNGAGNPQNNDNYAHYLLSYYEEIKNPPPAVTNIQNIF
jgi:hypothetical protein